MKNCMYKIEMPCEWFKDKAFCKKLNYVGASHNARYCMGENEKALVVVPTAEAQNIIYEKITKWKDKTQMAIGTIEIVKPKANTFHLKRKFN